MRHSHLLALLSAFAMTLGSFAAVAATLSGQVSSTKEGAMEGVLVTVRREGSSISTTVVSDARGHYAFPSDRLVPGRYAVSIRALGYVLENPRTVELHSSDTQTDLRLGATADLAPQLTNSEWLLSAPGTAAEKRDFTSCATCHDLTLPILSSYTSEQLRTDLLVRMAGMSSQAMPGLVQKRPAPQDVHVFGDPDRLARYIASINLSSSGTVTFPLHGFDRPKGASTDVIVTSYKLPRSTMQPHDAVMGDDGYVWISNFGENSLARLDPRSGAVKEYTYPSVRRGAFANGNLDLEFDRQGHIWLALMNQTGIARFDRRTEKFDLYPLPAPMTEDVSQSSMVAPINAGVDGKIWVQAVSQPQITRFDLATRTYEPWSYPFRSLTGIHAAYGVYSDSRNNGILCDFATNIIWRLDAATGAAKAYYTPTAYSRPRRGRMDSQDRLWFAEWWGDKIGMFDAGTGEIREWDVPGYFPEPYDAELDKNGWVWTDNMMDDRVTRIDTRTGQSIQYLMPVSTNARRVAVDQRAGKPVLWVGANHEATVMKVEPLD